MTKSELIKGLLKSPNLEEEMASLLESGRIEYEDLLTKEQQQTLNKFFDTNILESPSYPRFPLFYRIQELLNKKDIDLNELDLENDFERSLILDLLFKNIIAEGNYTIYTPRILQEIFSALARIKNSSNQEINLAPLAEIILEISAFLYEQTESEVSLNSYEQFLQEAAQIYLAQDEVDKIIKFYNRILKWLEPKADEDSNFALRYLSDIASLISFLYKTNDNTEIGEYLRKYVHAVRHYYIFDDRSFIPVTLSLNILVPSLGNIEKPVGKTLYYIKELAKLLEHYLRKPKLSIFDRENLFVDLGFIYCVLGDYAKSQDYLVKETELVNENNIKRELMSSLSILDLVTKLLTKLSKEEGDKLLKDIYHINNYDDLLLYLTDGEFNMDDFFPDEKEEEFKEYTSAMENQDLLYQNQVEEDPNPENLTDLAIIKLGMAMDYMTLGEFRMSERKLAELSPVIDKLKECNDPEIIDRIKFEEELIKTSINFLKDKDVSSSKFIDKISDLIDSYLKDYKNSDRLLNPLTPLEKLAAVLIKENRLETALALLKVIDEVFIEFPPTLKNKDALNSYILLLFNIRSLLKEEEVQKWSDERIMETLENLTKLDITPREYIDKVLYMVDGFENEEQNNLKEALSNYYKAIESLKLYPDRENVFEIAERLGQLNFIIGKIQNQMGQEETALESFNKALSYLTKFKINKENQLHLLTLLSVNLYLSEYYINHREFKKAVEVMEKQYQIFKNDIGKIDTDTLLYTYLNTLDHLYVSYQELGEYEKQEEILRSAIDLLDLDYIQMESFSDLLTILASFVNMKHTMEMENEIPGLWKLGDYIEDIYEKLEVITDNIFIQDYDTMTKESMFSLYFAYLDYLLSNKKSIPVNLLDNAEFLCSQLLSENTVKRDDLKQASQFIRLLKARFN